MRELAAEGGEEKERNEMVETLALKDLCIYAILHWAEMLGHPILGSGLYNLSASKN